MKTLILSLALCAGLSVQAATKQEIMDNVSLNVITATYKDLAATAATMSAKIDVLVADPSEANLAAAQQAWRDTRVPWETSEAFIFGPVESLGLDPMMDTWPLNILDLDGVLASNRDLTVEFVRGIGTNLQGFHTIEYLLFGDGVHSSTKPAASLTPRQLQYLHSTGVLLAEYTGRLAASWTTNYNPEDPSAPGFAEIIRNPNRRNPFYTSERAVFEEFVRGMMGIANEVGSGKMSDPLGADVASANGSLVESPFSWNSLNDFANNIRSIQNVYHGSYNGHAGPGLRDWVMDLDPALAQKFDDKITNCIALIEQVAGPNRLDFRQAIYDGEARNRTNTAIRALADLHQTFEREMLPLLDR
jgi:putative iron-regulated protein